jgi:hypothetical protein
MDQGKMEIERRFVESCDGAGIKLPLNQQDVLFRAFRAAMKKVERQAQRQAAETFRALGTVRRRANEARLRAGALAVSDRG